MRTGEVDGVSYYFEDDISFENLHFFEHVKYGDYQYGSSKEALQRAWGKNDLASLIVETDGVKSYLEALGDQVYFIYLTVKDPEILLKRLIERGDDPIEIKRRLNSSEFKRDLHLRPELKQNAHILENDNLADTKKSLDDIVKKLAKS